MADLYLDDIDAAAQALDGHGYPTLAAAVRQLVTQNERLTELLDEAHDELARHRDGGIYVTTEGQPCAPHS